MRKIDELIANIEIRQASLGDGVQISEEEWKTIKGVILAAEGALGNLYQCDINDAAIQLAEALNEVLGVEGMEG